MLYATRTLHVTTHDYGLMLLGVGVGGAAGGLVNTRIAKRMGAIPALIASYTINSLEDYSELSFRIMWNRQDIA